MGEDVGVALKGAIVGEGGHIGAATGFFGVVIFDEGYGALGADADEATGASAAVAQAPVFAMHRGGVKDVARGEVEGARGSLRAVDPAHDLLAIEIEKLADGDIGAAGIIDFLDESRRETLY